MFMKHTPWIQIVHLLDQDPLHTFGQLLTILIVFFRNFMHDCTTEVLTEPLMMIQAVLL